MKHGRCAACLKVLRSFVAALACGTAEAAREETVDGYAEYRAGEALVVEGQRVLLAPRGRFKGEGAARDFGAIPLGYEVKAKGTRDAQGIIVAGEVEAKPNGDALFEKNVRSATDSAEEGYRKAGRFYEEGPRGVRGLGRLLDRGPEVDRVRAIVEDLLPPYLDPGDVRVYVIENPEWNAFAMGNYSLYVFTGLLDDVDDDELSVVLGHELAHATHEHTRRQFKKRMWIQIAALGITVAAQDIDDRTQRLVAQLATRFLAVALTNGYGRNFEDQADRVGLRYAFEAGYDVTTGPRLWGRFARKYAQPGRVATFFFSDHSQSAVRARNLERELAHNYREGRKTGREPRGRRERGAERGER